MLPAARGGVVTGVLLAVARIAGEAAPVLFTAGYDQWWNVNVAQGPMASLPVQIYHLRHLALSRTGTAWPGPRRCVLVALVFAAERRRPRMPRGAALRLVR